MRHKKKRKPVGRPRPPVDAVRGNHRQMQKFKAKHMIPGGEESTDGNSTGLLPQNFGRHIRTVP